MRSANIARVFDKQENLDALVELINRECDDSEAVLLPAIIGLNREDALEFLRQKVGKPIFLLSTLPPSVPGIHAQQQLRKYFQQCGGVYMLGDMVLRAECEGNWVLKYILIIMEIFLLSGRISFWLPVAFLVRD